jgi:raffinose/stachyose/melibiose transport system substrate-binding protein
MKKSIMLLSTILIGASIITAGCGSNQEKGSASTSPASSSSSSKIKLTMTDSFSTTSTQAVDLVHRQLIEQFKKDNPNIDLSEDTLDNASLKTKIKTLAAGNDLPDVFMLLGSDAKMFLDNKLILPIDDILAQDTEWKNGFIPEAFNDFKFDGKLAGAPLQMTSTSIIYYNQAIFKKAGFDKFPATWDEFITAAQKIKAMGITPITLGNKDQWVAESCLLSALGDRFTGTEWFNNIRDKKGAKFTDKPFVDALTAMQQLSKIGAFNSDLNSLDNNQQRTAYYNGKAAMFIEGGWAVSSIVTDAPKDISANTHLAIFPAVSGGAGKADSTSGGSGWAIALNANLKGDKLKAAVDFAKLMTGGTAANMAAEKGDMSGSVAKNFDKSKSNPLFQEYMALLQKVTMTPVYDVQLPPSVIQTMNKGLQELLIPNSPVTPDKLAKDIQDSYSGS